MKIGGSTHGTAEGADPLLPKRHIRGRAPTGPDSRKDCNFLR